MPPCALAELHDWSDPLAATATRAPARSAETAADRPDAPLPTTSTSKPAGSLTLRTLADIPNPCDNQGLSVDLVKKRLDLGGCRRARVRLVAGARCGCSRDVSKLVLGHAEVAQPAEAAEPGELLDFRRRVVRRPDRRAEALD